MTESDDKAPADADDPADIEIEFDGDLGHRMCANAGHRLRVLRVKDGKLTDTNEHRCICGAKPEGT